MSLRDYRFFIYGPDGTRRASLESARYCNFTKRLNSPGALEIAIPINDNYAPAGDDIIDVNPSYTKSSTLYLGVFSGETRRTLDGVGESRILRYPGNLAILQYIVNAYKTGDIGQSLFTSTDTDDIIDLVLRYNLNDATIANGRIRDGEFRDYIRNTTAPSSGTTLDTYRCAYRYVYDIIIELCELGGHDIEATWSGNDPIFNVHGDGMGSNQNLSLVTGDHLVPEDTLIQDHDFRSVAFAAGQGIESARTVEARTGASYSAGVNGREMFIDYPNAANSASLQEKADAALAQELTRGEKRYRVVNSPVVRIDDNLKLGDTFKIDGTTHRCTAIEYNLNEAEIIHIRAREV